MARVLVVGKYYHPFKGGIEQNTRAIAERLAVDHEVTVLCNNHNPGHRIDTIAGVQVKRTRTIATIKSQPIGIATFINAIRAKADLIHFHAPNPWLSLAVYLRMLLPSPPKLVVTHHMDMFGRPVLRFFARKIYNRLLRKSSLLIATSRKNVAVSRDIQVDCPVVAIPLGIEVDEYQLSQSARNDARAWGRSLSGGRAVAGFIGRHARYKGLEVFVRAIALDRSIVGLIAGDGPYRSGAEQLARELGIEDRVVFLGSLTHLEKLKFLASLDVFVFPSTEITEAFGISQVEAMAMGVPVVASELPTGVSDVSMNEVTALTIRPGDPRDLQRALRRMLDDSALRERLVENALARVRAMYINSDNAARTAEVIEEQMDRVVYRDLSHDQRLRLKRSE